MSTVPGSEKNRIAEEVRAYFMNTNPVKPSSSSSSKKELFFHRQQDLDSSSSSSSSFELDSSFQKLLSERKAFQSKMNKENAQRSDRLLKTSTKSNSSPFKAVDNVILKENTDKSSPINNNTKKLLPKTVSQNNKDEETKIINHLFTEFNIQDYQTQLMTIEQPPYFSQVSPVKMIGLLRPSTVYEESFKSVPETSTGFATADREVLSTATTNASNISKDSLNESISKLVSCDNSFKTAKWNNYRVQQSFSTFCNNTTDNSDIRDSLNQSISNTERDAQNQTINSLNMAVSSTSVELNNVEALNASKDINETLEEIEYVEDHGIRYIPKTPIEQSSGNTNHPNIKIDNLSEIIYVESSPESYVTAKQSNSNLTHEYIIRTRNCQDSNTTNDWNQTANIVDLTNDDDETDYLTRSLDDVSSLISDITSKLSSNIEVEDNYIHQDSRRQSIEKKNRCQESQHFRSFNLSTEFNDTLERVEYMMELGEKIMEQKSPCLTPFNNNPKVEITPALRMTPKTPNTLIRKKQSGSTEQNKNVFKKPSFQSITPGVLKKPPTHTGSKIPKPKASSVPKKPHCRFDYIVSPIGVYIKNMAPFPLATAIKTDKNFFDSSYCSRAAKTLNFSDISSTSSGSSSSAKFPTNCIPRKAYISAEKRYLRDDRSTKMPGGEKIHQIIGKTPILIRHEGHIDMGICPDKVVDDSFADLSLMVGDVSVQVVRNVKRM